MTSPECVPGEFPLLQPKNKELDWPEKGPRTVCKVTASQLCRRQPLNNDG